MGTAVNNALDEMFNLIAATKIERLQREEWLEDIWEAYQEDGMGYLDSTGEKWGILCGNEDYSRDLASKWAERMIDGLKLSWDKDKKEKYGGGYFRGTTVCLSSMLKAEKYQALIDLVEEAPYKWWHYCQFAAQALRELKRYDDAIKYAEESKGLNDPKILIDIFCEETLLDKGDWKIAYEQYALSANQKNTKVATFRAIKKKYPQFLEDQILKDLIDSSFGEEGKWFATAKTIGRLDIALQLAKHHPCEPQTLNRAAEEFLEKNPAFSFEVAGASLKWMALGYGYNLVIMMFGKQRGYLKKLVRPLTKRMSSPIFCTTLLTTIISTIL
ncbi:MAG: hypothetical protein HQK51_08005 [Oligoflexia bacterium]|nr:hypothetical protein [Oligoflexia bacterium]